MKIAKLAILATSMIVTPIAASAQDVGATVYGNDDAPIGTVESNDGAIVTINTGVHMAPLPADLLAEREIGWTVNATKVQIDAMMAQQLAETEAQLDAALMVGAALVSADGQPAGTVFAIDAAADAIIVEREAGIITLKREHFAIDANGALMALFTLDQIAANTMEVPEGAEIVTASQIAETDTAGGVSE
jgi:hypothetical protein